MDQQLQDKIIPLAGPGNWEEGQKMQRENAVLDIHKEGKVLEARVANNVGSFERVKIQFKGSSISVRCTCGKRSSEYCQHSVATILQLSGDDPELLGKVFSESRKPNKNVPLPTAEDSSAPTAAKPAAEPRDLSWKSFLERRPDRARMELRIDGPAPWLESRWKRVELHIYLIYNRRKYSAGNMKQLVEVGAGSGGMELDDFSLQEQQLMRFLVGGAEMIGNRYVLNSYQMADLMHCLSGCASLTCSSGRIGIHPEPLQLALQVKESDNGTVVVPRFILSGYGMLSAEEARPVVGRGGSWLGFGTDYWWLPGVADSAWMRSLLKNRTAAFSSAELQHLDEACKQRRIPARLVAADEESEVQTETGACRPVLTLDWEGEEITGTVEFDYGGSRISLNGPRILWQGERFISRDSAREDNALQTLENMGFRRTERGQAVFALADPELLLPFLESGFNELEEDWIIYYSTRFNRKRDATGDLSMRATTRREGESWFELDCEIRSEDDQRLPLEQVLQALEQGCDYIRLESGAVARISDSLRNALSFYLERKEEQTERGFRFGRYAALPVLRASGSYLRSRKSQWQRLCRRLMNPFKPEQIELPSASLEESLRDYQKEGVAWLKTLEESGFHGILADEMGLGKTLQALAVLLARKTIAQVEKPSLIVCPTSLVENWHAEAERFTPELRTAVISGSDRKNVLKRMETAAEVDVAITSYALLRRDIEEYIKFAFDYIILDEAQHIKNPETANARTCKALASGHRLILTGTPVENSIREIWSLFDFLMPGMLGDRQSFRNNYEIAGSRDEGAKGGGAAVNLARQIHPFILRRTKAEVCKQLPEKLEHVVYCEFDQGQRQLYNQLMTTANQMLRKAKSEGWNKNRMDLLSILLRLRQLCCHPRLLPEDLRHNRDGQPFGSAKTELLKEIILEAIDGDHRMLIFSQFTKMLKIITDWLREQGIPYEYLDGATKDRQNRVNRFNRDNSIPVFIISLKAGGTGFNLTGADTVIHYDPWWNPMVEDQATDRTHRIGQENIVTSFKLVARHTIEEKIVRLQAGKRELFNQLVGEAPAKLGQLTPEDFEYLLGQ